MADRDPFDFAPHDLRPLAVALAHVLVGAVVMLALIGACAVSVWWLA